MRTRPICPSPLCLNDLLVVHGRGEPRLALGAVPVPGCRLPAAVVVFRRHPTPYTRHPTPEDQSNRYKSSSPRRPPGHARTRRPPERPTAVSVVVTRLPTPDCRPDCRLPICLLPQSSVPTARPPDRPTAVSVVVTRLPTPDPVRPARFAQVLLAETTCGSFSVPSRLPTADLPTAAVIRPVCRLPTCRLPPSFPRHFSCGFSGDHCMARCWV